MSLFNHKYIVLLRGYFAQILSTLLSPLLPFLPPTSLLHIRPHLLSPDTNLIPHLKWLESILISSSDSIGYSIRSARIDPLAVNRGLAGNIYKIWIEYEEDGKNDLRPRSLIVKTSRDGVTGRMAVIRNQHREAQFYISDLVNDPNIIVSIPKIYYSYCSCILGEIVIIMEDLIPAASLSNDDIKEKKNIGVNMICGNQIWGRSDKIDWNIYDMKQVIHDVFNAAARFHAAHWKNPKLLCKDSFGGWLKGAGWYRNENRSEWESAIATSHAAWTTFLDRIQSGSNPNLNLSPDLINLISNSFQNASWDVMRSEILDPSRPFTLCHGDFHASNMVYIASDKAESNPIKIYDWSEVGPWDPMTDLGQMVISDLQRDLYREFVPSAVRNYWERLTSSGCVSAAEYPFEICWRHFCTGGIERWVFIFPLLAAYPQMPENAVQYFHDQMCAFVKAFTMEGCSDGVWPKSIVLKTVVCV